MPQFPSLHGAETGLLCAPDLIIITSHRGGLATELAGKGASVVGGDAVVLPGEVLTQQEQGPLGHGRHSQGLCCSANIEHERLALELKGY